MLKHAYDEDYLIKQAGIIFSRLEDESGNQLSPVLVYFFSLLKNKTKMIRAIDIMPEPVKGKARNAYEELILEGMEKKIKAGSINLYKNGVPIDIIAKSFEITEAEVKQILTEAGINL